MSRKQVKKRKLANDPIYDKGQVTKFINYLMIHGKKSIAEKIFYSAIKLAQSKLKIDDMEVFEQAITNVKPFVEVKSRRVGGVTYQVPVEVTQERGVTLAIRWIIKCARARKGIDMYVALAQEIQDAANGTGAAVKIKENTHKMAEANKAFAHFRW